MTKLLVMAQPENVHPEYDQPTPDNIGEWSDAQLQQYRILKEQEHESEAQERRRELSQEQRETLDLLSSATAGDDEVVPRNVRVGDAQLTVNAKIDGATEMKLDAIADAKRIGEVRDTLIELITTLIIDDDEPDDDPHDFQDPAVWREFHRQNSSEALFEVFEIVAGPAMERREQLEFRGEQRDGPHGA